ncbi:Uncharacterised protein [Vibrio cholerae]|nr:Uncharacterised protein [Vibrio cholerae]CSH85684.1 Uncharacterised protein [Vibrio cholerae]
MSEHRHRLWCRLNLVPTTEIQSRGSPMPRWLQSHRFR